MGVPADYPRHGDRTPAAQAQRETHWRRILERFKQSGLKQGEFCRRENLHESSLSWWARELRERPGRLSKKANARKPRRRGRSTFVPVQIVAAAPLAAASDAPVEVVTRAGHVVRVHPGFDPALLRRVLAALEAPAC